MKKSEAEDIERVISLVRQNHLRKADSLVKALAARRISREGRLRLAFACSTGRLPRLAARLLYGQVKGPAARRTPPTDEEKAEYAVAIIALGAVTEGERILRELDRKRLPRVYRFLVWARFRQWDWSATLPLFDEALAISRLTASDELGLKVLWGNALLHGPADFARAEKLLDSVAGETSRERFPIYHWEAQQLLGQSSYLQGEWREALRRFDRADALFPPQGGGQDRALLVRKFRALIRVRESGKRGLGELAEIQARFRSVEDWEQARSCDYYRALATRDEDLLVKLCYGTPYPAFRAKLLAAFGSSAESLPDAYSCPIGPAKANALRLDPRDPRSQLKRGQIPERLISVLAGDLWCPRSTAQLHQELYPGDHFNPDSSPYLITQAVMRTRRWLEDERLPLRIGFSHERYSLESGRGILLRRYKDEWPSESSRALPPKLALLVTEAKGAFGQAPFRAADLQARLSMSRATVVGLLARAIERGLAETTGSGPQTRYRLL